jgi:DNA polymerase V
MKAIVDCNNFYCSCERLFQPKLEEKPVVVLSNNDGCVISRSDEAKVLGISMGVPLFEVRDLLRAQQVAVFSSNYALYGDLSWRVMEVLRNILGSERVEVYSVDEAFLELDELGTEELEKLALSIRNQVEQWTGIRVSIGVGPTKTLAKLANRLAKKNKVATNCVMVLSTESEIEEALRRTAVADLWGIGRRYGKQLRERWGIYDGWQLAQVNETFAAKYLGGVVGARLVRELRGIPSRMMEEERVQKKMIATTRMFGRKVYELQEIREAIATYTARAAEKLRRQFSAAGYLSVFIISHAPGQRHGMAYDNHCTLERPSADSSVLIHKALELVNTIFKPGLVYKKAGVVLGDIVPESARQGSLFSNGLTKSDNHLRNDYNKNQSNDRDDDRLPLMLAIDNINFSCPPAHQPQHDSILRFAAAGTNRGWKMKQEFRSPRYTTKWLEMRKVR